MLTTPDFKVIGFYLALLCLIGWVFRRFTGSMEEYFAGGRRMTWWLLGADSFQSNFSCWVFTGAASVAYTHGSLIFGFYLVDALSFTLAYFWFAGRFRQLGVVTAIDAVRMRFGRHDEKFYAVLSIIASLAFASMRTLALAVILSHAFGFPPLVVIALTVTVVMVVALLGGSWAVAAMNAVQLVMVVSVTTVVAILAINHTGGWNAFLAQIPTGHWQILKPIGATSYDWIFIVSGLLAASYAKNNLLFTSKYIAAFDAQDARRSSLVPLAGYLIMPLIWMIPVFAAFTLVPDLVAREGTGNPGEWAYIAVCAKILPAGLFGLVVVCMLATTISSVSFALNASAGSFTQNIYRPWRKENVSSSELVVTGKVSTLLLGLLVGSGCLALASSGLTLFDALFYIGAYLNVPIAVPLFLGLFFRGEPWWAPRVTTLFCILMTVAVYEGLPALLTVWQSSGTAWEIAAYLGTHKFVATNLVIVPASAALFIILTRSARTLPVDVQQRQTFFFAQSQTTNVPASNRNQAYSQQSRLIGRFLAGATGCIALLALVAESTSAQISIASCAALPALLAIILLLHARRLARQS